MVLPGEPSYRDSNPNPGAPTSLGNEVHRESSWLDLATCYCMGHSCKVGNQKMKDQRAFAEQIFGEALDLPREERAAFLVKACRDKPAVRQVVEALLEE